MKPIEIHIEGYKIVISEDNKENITYKQEKDDDDKITYPNYPHNLPYPYIPPTIQPQDEWWKYPITWLNKTPNAKPITNIDWTN